VSKTQVWISVLEPQYTTTIRHLEVGENTLILNIDPTYNFHRDIRWYDLRQVNVKGLGLCACLLNISLSGDAIKLIASSLQGGPQKNSYK